MDILDTIWTTFGRIGVSKLSKITRIKLFLKENSWTVPDQFGSPDLDNIWGGGSGEASSWHYMADPSSYCLFQVPGLAPQDILGYYC